MFPDVSLWAKSSLGNCGFPDVCLWAKSCLRFHIGAACEQLTFLPHCAVQESKHQEIKRSLIDTLEGCLGDSLRLQKALVSRLALQNAESNEQLGLGKWGLGNPVREATEEDKFSFKDCGLSRADHAYMWKRHVSLGDMVLFTDKVGGQFLMAVSGPACGLHFLFETMEKKQTARGAVNGNHQGKESGGSRGQTWKL